MEFVMKMFVNIQAFPSTLQSRCEMDALLVEPKQISPVTPTMYGHCIAIQIDNTLKYLNKRDRLCL